MKANEFLKSVTESSSRRIEMADELKEALGAEQALEEVFQAMSTDQAEDIFEFIKRQHDF